MNSKAKYVIVVIFLLVVFGGLFLMYLAVNSPAKTVFFSGPPTVWEKTKCILGAGKLDSMIDDTETLGGCQSLEGASTPCIRKTVYSCIYK